jgi:hypothetical protein
MNADRNTKSANETQNSLNRLKVGAKKIVAPSPEPSQQGDGKGLFRWAVRKGLVNQQAPEPK